MDENALQKRDGKKKGGQGDCKQMVIGNVRRSARGQATTTHENDREER